MTEFLVLFAQLDALNPLNPTAPGTRTTGIVFKDVLVIVATGLALGLLLLLWARHYVKRRKRHHHHDRKGVSHAVPDVTGEDPAEEPRHQTRRRRKRRRDHRPRNPTLAETGGLPTNKTETLSNPPS
jgi:hypothetical protein